MGKGVKVSLILPALAGAALLAAPACAETPAQLEAMARATSAPASGIALARSEMNAGDFLAALATLERVILNYPENEEARLLHAGVFCRIDERRGALLELDDLRGRNFPDALWAEATAPCSPAADAGREG